ncbi:MAG: hypothetical protein RR571_03560 [Anaerorhabdus sp.]
MKQISVLVIDPVGLHARPATVAVNALGIPTQSEVVVSCEGEDEEIAIKTIEEVLRAQKVIA